MILAKSRLVFHVCIFQEGFRQDEDNDKSDYDQSDDEQSDGYKEEHYWWDCPFCKNIGPTAEERDIHLDMCTEKLYLVLPSTYLTDPV